MWIFPWIKFFWHSCSMWDKLHRLNWFWQFLWEGLSSINLKGFYYSDVWHGLAVYMKELLDFAWHLPLEKSTYSYLFLTGFTSLSVLLLFSLLIIFFVFMHGFLFLFHRTKMRFSWSTHLMCLSLETLMFIIWTG